MRCRNGKRERGAEFVWVAFEIFYENDCIPRKRKDGIKMKILVLSRFEREDQCVVFFFL